MSFDTTELEKIAERYLTNIKVDKFIYTNGVPAITGEIGWRTRWVYYINTDKVQLSKIGILSDNQLSKDIKEVALKWLNKNKLRIELQKGRLL